jgi:ATP-dependent protease ClpP protease subunit
MPDLDDMIEQLRRMKAPTAARPWYEVHAKADDRTATIRIYDDIGWFGTSAKTFGDELAALDVDAIDLRLNSPGGDAWDGLAIHNALRAHPATVTVTVDGMAASAASLVAMGGDKIRMNRGSQMMVHDAWGLSVGNAADMLKTAEMLGKVSDSYADVYAARAGGTRAQWRDVMREETWYTAQEAVDAGLADSLVDDAPDASARYDLAAYAFAHAGRAAAPPPAIFTARPAPAAPSAAEAIRRVHAATTKTTTASPAGGTKEGATQVDPVKLREALGLAPDASDDEVKASAQASLNLPAAPAAAPPEGTPAPAAPIPTAAAPGTVVRRPVGAGRRCGRARRGVGCPCVDLADRQLHPRDRHRDQRDPGQRHPGRGLRSGRPGHHVACDAGCRRHAYRRCAHHRDRPRQGPLHGPSLIPGRR